MPPNPKHTTKSTAAQRPRPPRDGARRNTFHALAHLARFHRSRVCGNRPRTALAISKNDECYTYTQTKRIMEPCTYPGMKRFFVPVGQKRPRSLRSLGLASLSCNYSTVGGTDIELHEAFTKALLRKVDTCALSIETHLCRSTDRWCTRNRRT